ncbi:MAG: sterol-binding protein [Gammaproteobacteria bacterium]|nr:sterol-binding protein [Gammaproteobacteria bacterium]
MNALEALMRPLIRLVNRQLQAKTPARELCAELDGRVIAIRVRNTALALYFLIHRDELEVTAVADNPDVVISGSLIALARLAGPSADAAIRDGSVDLSGDAETAQAFQQLLAYGKPDIEEELSGVLGDVAARGLGDIARNVGRWAENTHATVQQNIQEYLQEESRSVPSRYEVENFRDQAETLRDDVDRVEARIRRLEQAVD